MFLSVAAASQRAEQVEPNAGDGKQSGSKAVLKLNRNSRSRQKTELKAELKCWQNQRGEGMQVREWAEKLR